MDAAATTPIGAEVLQGMLPFFTTDFGNAASLHTYGRAADAAVNKARRQIAKSIGAEPNEIYFTSGATEANNWIINGLVRNSESKRVIISAIEHPSIYELCLQLRTEGYEVDLIEVDQNGIVSMSDLVHKLSRPAALVSVMTANNEVGTVQYINTIANMCKKYGVPFHTDAAQALGSVHINVKDLHIDALSLSAHKIYGPKGIGALYISNDLNVERFLTGGHQERKRRGGTHNVPAIVGFGHAVEVTMRDSSINNARIKQLRDYMIREIESKIEHVHLNGHRMQRLPNNVNFSFSGISGEALLMTLDMDGIAVGTGSACASGSIDRSHALNAMGVAAELNRSAIRFSLSRSTTKDDIDYVVSKLQAIVKKLRPLSGVAVFKKEV